MKRNRYRIARNLLDGNAFCDWWKSEGKAVHYDLLLRTRARWFFGAHRARRRLERAAKRVFDPAAPFALELERYLDDLPAVVRRIGLAIRRRGHCDLFTVDGDKTIIVIPRGIVKNDFTTILMRELADSPHAGGLPGLARRLLPVLAEEAEDLLFKNVLKGRDSVDKDGGAFLLAVDPNFRWAIQGTNGHYFLAMTSDDVDFSNRRSRRRFRADVSDILHAQQVFLKRMDGVKRAAVAEPFRV